MFPNIRRPLVAALLGASAMLVAAGAAQADPAPPFAALLAEAQSRSSRLSEAAATVRQAEGQALQARARPNPTTSVQAENFAASTPFGRDQAQTTFTFEQQVELGGKRSARIQAGRAGVVSAQARERETQTEYAFNLALQYARAEAAEHRVNFAQDTLRLTQENLKVAQTLFDAGRESQLRVVQVQGTVATASAQLDSARIEQVDALAQLTSLASSPTAYTSLSGTLLERPADPVPATIQPAATPAVIAAEAERDAAARRVNVERVRAIPDVTASVGFRRFPFDNSTALVAGVSTSLPLFDRNRGNIASARAQLEAAEARLNTARLDAEAGVRSAQFQIDAATGRLRSVQAAEQSAAETYRLTRTGYESGKLALLELLTAQRALTEARAQVVDAQLARVRAEAELARLQGRAPFGG